MENLFEEGDYYTIADVATRLKVNPLTVRRWINAKQVEGLRIGKLIRIKGDSILKYIKKY